MRIMICFPLVIFLLADIALTDLHARNSTVSFSWALLVDGDHGQTSADIKSSLSIGEKSTLQFYFSREEGTFLYLFLLDSGGSLALIFPETPDHYATSPPNAGTFRVPPDPDRFSTAPPPGQERLYLLASSTRLTTLEELAGDHSREPDDPRLKAAILQEMKKLRRKHSTLSQSPEASVPVAGTIRTRSATPGTKDTFMVTKVSGVQFYSRTLRINHE